MNVVWWFIRNITVTKNTDQNVMSQVLKPSRLSFHTTKGWSSSIHLEELSTFEEERN